MNKLLIAFILGAFLLFGCLSGVSNFGDGGSAVSSPSMPGSLGLPSKDVSQSNGQGQMVIKTGSVSVLVPQGTLEDRLAKLKTSVAGNGGDISGVTYNEYSTQKAYSITLKIDPAKFDTLLTEIKGLGEVKSVDTNLEDVTTQYRDLGVRITNLQKELDSLNSLYNKTDKIDDILKIRDEISTVETQLELYEQQKLDLDRRAAKSTITVNLYEEKSAVDRNLFVPLGDLASVFFGAMGLAITAIVGILGFLIPGAIILGIGYGIWKLVRRNPPAERAKK